MSLDTPLLVRYCPYIIQGLLVWASDIYFWQIVRKCVDEQASVIVMVLYITNRLYNQVVIRCFTNGVESILMIIGLYYYLKARDDRQAFVKMNVVIAVGFMIRATSIIGWVPLILI